MNKIIVAQEEKKLENIDIILEEITVENLVLHIYGKVNCGILSIPKYSKIKIYLHQDSFFNIDFFVKLNDTTNEIYIYNENNTSLTFNYACTFSNQNNVTIYNNINSNKTNTKVYVRAVEDNGTLNIKAEGCIYENTFSNDYLEDIKAIISNNNTVKIMPNLLVKTNTVVANHNATISNVSNNELFYLTCRGIINNEAKKLIKSGFLKGILKIDEIKGEVKIENA